MNDEQMIGISITSHLECHITSLFIISSSFQKKQINSKKKKKLSLELIRS